MCCIECKNERVLFASDCQGPVSETARDWIIYQKPDLLVMDGPPTYFLGYKFSMQNLDKARDNMLAIIKETKAKVILDHHLLRDLKYKQHFKEVFDTGKALTAAEFLGKENNMLEARRKELWKDRRPNYTLMPLKKDVKYD
jgi:predicted metallo-beta-lactamase superfamily hydrolase